VDKYPLTKNRWQALAVALAAKYPDQRGLVMFFDAHSALVSWIDTGALRGRDWPHWLCSVALERGRYGDFEVTRFAVGKDSPTGEERSDVVAEEHDDKRRR